MNHARGMREKSPPIYDSNALRIPLIYEVQELVRYRFLLWNLIVKDLKVRYKRSSIGFIWVMLNPLLTMAVLTVVFSQVFRFNLDYYAVQLLGGTLVWNLYAQGTNASMASLQGNGIILRKLYVPPSIFVASAIGSALVNFVFALAPFLVLTLFNGVYPSFTWLFMLVPALLATMFSFGLGLIVAALIAFFNDIFEIYQVLLSAYYFLTPIFYPLSTLPEPLRSMEQYNPMFLFIDSFRTAVVYHSLPGLHELLISVTIATGTLLVGWMIFTRVEGKFVYQF